MLWGKFPATLAVSLCKFIFIINLHGANKCRNLNRIPLVYNTEANIKLVSASCTGVPAFGETDAEESQESVRASVNGI